MVAAAVRGVLQGAQSAGAAGRARATPCSSRSGDSESDASDDELSIDGIGSAASAVQDLSASLVSAAAGGEEQVHAPRQRGRRRARRRGAGEPAGGVLEQVLALLKHFPFRAHGLESQLQHCSAGLNDVGTCTFIVQVQDGMRTI